MNHEVTLTVDAVVELTSTKAALYTSFMCTHTHTHSALNPHPKTL